MNINIEDNNIINAKYGKNNIYIDCTLIIVNNINQNILISNKLFRKDPIINIVKELIITLDNNNIIIIPENTNIIISKNIYIPIILNSTIIKCTYGKNNYIDCTDIILNNLNKNICINNTLFLQDPAPDVIKELIIYIYNNNNYNYNNNNNNNINKTIILEENKLVNIVYKKSDIYDKTNFAYISNTINNEINHDSILIRNITNIEEICKLYTKNRLPFIVYSEESFYTLYNDFNISIYIENYIKYNNNNKNIENIENNSTHSILYDFHSNNENKKLIYTEKIKVIIYTPILYVKCGGVVALHYLAKLINTQNSNIYAKLYCYDGSKYINDFCNDFANPYEINDNTIVIYPEIVSGNPLNAKHVIRWILLELGIEMPLDHYKKWNKSDIIYTWEPSKNKLIPQLTVPFLNKKIINTNSKKTKTCYLIKKGRLTHNIKYFHPIDSILIDNMNLDQIIKIFNESTQFYCYDPNTFYSIMAPLCGCITILYPLENISKDEYFKSRMTFYKDYLHTSGIAYSNSNEEILNAKNTLSDATESFNKLLSLYTNSINDFLHDIDSYFNKNVKLPTVEDIFYKIN